jgi:hypothetical protein
MLFELGVVVQIGAEKVLFPTGYVTAAEHDRAGLFACAIFMPTLVASYQGFT